MTAALDYDAITSAEVPTPGQAVQFTDAIALIAMLKDGTGRCYGRSRNASVASQPGSPGFASDTYVINSNMLIPSCGLQVGTRFHWKISANKGGASTGTPAYTLRIGTALGTGDTSVGAVTGPAQTAVADIGTLNVMATVRTIGGSATIQITAWWDHRGTAANTTTSGTGFANDSTGHVEGTGASFNSANVVTPGSSIGLSINGGASSTWTVTQVHADADW